MIDVSSSFFKAFNTNRSSRLRRPDFASLQVRLTLGVVLGVLFILATTVGLTLWKTERMLTAQHQQTLTLLAQQLPDSTPTVEKDLPQRLQAIVDQLAAPNLWIWFRDRNGQILAQSSELHLSPASADLLALDRPVPQPMTIHIQNRVFELYTSPLRYQGESIGQFYVTQDVTQNHAMLNQIFRSALAISAMAIVLLSLFVTWFIRRSLRPLNRLQQATTRNITLPLMEAAEVPTEVRELARTYSQLRDRLSESNLKQQQFTDSISHELRTPLSLVYGYLQSTLKRCPNLTESQQEALSIAVLETENIIQLLQELLEGARRDSTLLKLRQETVLINPIAEEVVQMVQKFDHRPVRLEAAGAVWAIADPEALGRVLAHLLDNAVQYSAADQPILLQLLDRDEQVEIRVSDRGCGIAPSQQSLIFEPLYREESSRSRSTGGAGLGLSIARSLVEGMGGTITVQSEPGRGSTFTVTLRRAMP